MTQTTGPRPDNWRAPWATQPEAGEAPTTEGQASAPSDQAPASGWPFGGSTGTGVDPQPTQPTQPFSSGAYPPPPGSSLTKPPREPRRPGWPGVIAVGVATATVASLMTAGLMHRNDQQASAIFPPSSNSNSVAQNVPAPVSGSTKANPNWSAVAAAVEPSVVAVKVSGQSGSGEGSGVVLDTQGRVITNNHVVADAAGGGTIQVVLADGRGYPAKVVGTDPQTDIAVIQIQNAPSGLKPAVFGDSSAVAVGDPVMAVGNPLGLSDTVTTGIVSAVDRPVTTSSSETPPQQQNPFGGGQQQQQQSTSDPVVTNAIQTDAAINPGNSGGALVAAQGRVIGINSSIASLGSSAGGQSGSIGLGFAIPVNEVKDVASQLISTGKVQHAWLGVQLSEDNVTVNGAQLTAAIIQSVVSGSPSAKAGLQNGDAVIAVDGTPINGADSLVAQIRALRPGTTVKLTIVRNGSTHDVSVVLGNRPS